jgi:HEPN domain-containing protein
VSVPPELVDEWRAHARQDWKRMGVHLGLGDASAAGMFLQQALEKFLKGYLLARGWQLARIHDLAKLHNEARAFDPGLEPFRDLLRRVTDNYLADRYPGSGHVGPSEQDVRADVLEAMAFVARLFPDESLQAP